MLTVRAGATATVAYALRAQWQYGLPSRTLSVALRAGNRCQALPAPRCVANLILVIVFAAVFADVVPLRRGR